MITMDNLKKFEDSGKLPEANNLPIHYRYESYYSPHTERAELELLEFVIVRETPGGYWLVDKPKGDWFYKYLIKPKWVSKCSRKRFAYPTKEEAMTSFIARKRKQIAILTEQLQVAKAAYKAATGEDY